MQKVTIMERAAQCTGGRGGEPHAGGAERRVERDDDGARLHQGHGQVGHRLESGGQTRKQTERRKENKQANNQLIKESKL